MDLERYRESGQEKARTADILRLLPRGRKTILDIGARDGHFSRLLTEHFAQVTALDLSEPQFEFPGVSTMAGDVTNLPFPDDAFDCVLCVEVLEHVPDLAKAAAEIRRVAKREIVIGVPYRQDIRLGRTNCETCGKTNPPWGHIHSFTEARLKSLFPGWGIRAQSIVGGRRAQTSAVAGFLMDLGGNPWGTYDQLEPCIHCGAPLAAPARRPLWRKLCSAVAARMNGIQARLAPAEGIWIHMALQGPGARGP